MNTFKNKDTFKEAFTEKLKTQFNVNLKTASVYQLYEVLAELLNSSLISDYDNTRSMIEKNNLKQAIYFSMEFLMGRLITNNLQNSGHYQVVKEAFKEMKIDLNSLEDAESDAGLGNGGLGRLAACFLDSAASLGLPLYGNSLRYKKGFFVQKIIDNKQVELPDPWLENPFIWEERKEELAVDIPFFGYVEHTKLIDPTWIKAVPYDVKIVGDKNGVVTHLRLWNAESSSLQAYKDDKYYKTVSEICDSLYPDDSTDGGKLLRLKQQYLFSSAGIKAAIIEHKKLGRDIRKLHEYFVFQINDTHPTLIIPELMRILMDEENIGYDEAWSITTKSCAFTNHTILSEALEKWDTVLFRTLLPRIFEILREMDRRFREELTSKGFNNEQIYQMALIGNSHLRMANISIYGSFSVNGVAALHTEILKNIVMKDFNNLYPNKFNNKTNGITHRRWLIHTNQELVELLNNAIGTDWQKDLKLLKELEKFAEDEKFLNKLYKVKQTKKEQLADRIRMFENISLDANSIFDIQVKRLHEYKRQLMNILHVIYLYLRLKKDSEFKKNFHPQSFIYGAKAAPGYYVAKKVIELINAVGKIVNNDLDVNKHLKVVFVENYNVTYAEHIMPGADLSEQISTASKEASGTGNMKFMMNGALTIGTLDGANVEISDLAGVENEFIFGMTAKEVNEKYRVNNYHPREIYEKDQRLIDIFDFISTLNENPHYFDTIKHNLLNSDYFFVLADFDSYVKAQEHANQLYKNKKEWFKKVVYNIANSGFFTSDRTINEYNRDIWHLDKITF
ncbi:MAG: glycogen/starch/alpha-glucan phosphorylase [Acholeplasma sp.]|nr:glycogen/starch/alpha-glucan phosphorylase [Acholeplasma sp.]